MNLSKIVLITTILLLVISCNRKQCKSGLELIPMYGKEQKCDKQLEIDKEFLADCDRQYSSRKESTDAMLRFAWKNYAVGDLDLAMQRFNQAWLLDSLNTEVYIGFGQVLIDWDRPQESILFFEHSIRLNPNNPQAYKAEAIANSILFYNSSDTLYLDRSVVSLKKAIELKPNDSEIYGILTEVLSNYEQQDSARKYLEITDRMNPRLIKPELREKIRGIR